MSAPGRVLDSSAVLAVLGDEPGADRVREHLKEGARMSAVNVCETLGVLQRRGMAEENALRVLRRLGVSVEPFGLEHAVMAARLYTGSGRPLSLGDRACLALAAELGVPAVTCDAAWKKLQSGVEVEVVR